MADNKHSFVVFYDLKETIDKLSDEQVGILFRAMMEYEVDGTEPDFSDDLVMDLAWIPVRQTLTRSGAKYDEMIEKRRKAGSAGGKKRAENANAATQAKPLETLDSSSKSKQNQANQADSVSVSVSVSDSDSVSERDRVSDSDSGSGSVSEHDGAAHRDHHHDDLLHMGINENVELTQDEYDLIRNTYQSYGKLIDKVSTWLKGKTHPDHLALIQKFALNDNWPRRPEPEPPPEPLDPERGEVIPMPEEVRRKKEVLFGGGKAASQ